MPLADSSLDYPAPPAARGLAGWLGRQLRGARSGDDDWSLWHRSCNGDAAAATELVRRLTPQARGLALQLLRHGDDADDVVQESFLRLWGSRPSDAAGAQLATFFNTIVINRCKTLLVQRRELSLEQNALVELSDSRQDLTPASTTAGDTAAGLRSALDRLPARQRMALAMWAYADATVPEIARSLAIDANAAHQLLHRAKQALKSGLQGEKS